MDKPLYSIIFPMISVIAKGSCHDVERAVVGGREVEGFHWLQAFGIVDGDGYTTDQIQEKRDQGIYALPYYSVEAIYFHPEILKRIAIRQSGVLGEDVTALLNNALAAGVDQIEGHAERLSRNMVKKSMRRLIIEQIPNDDDLLEGQQIKLENNGTVLLAERKREIDDAVSSRDWETILNRCPVRESGALTAIIRALKFPRQQDYENAVRHLLSTDGDALMVVRKWFGDLYERLND